MLNECLPLTSPITKDPAAIRTTTESWYPGDRDVTHEGFDKFSHGPNVSHTVWIMSCEHAWSDLRPALRSLLSKKGRPARLRLEEDLGRGGAAFSYILESLRTFIKRTDLRPVEGPELTGDHGPPVCR